MRAQWNPPRVDQCLTAEIPPRKRPEWAIIVRLPGVPDYCRIVVTFSLGLTWVRRWFDPGLTWVRPGPDDGLVGGGILPIGGNQLHLDGSTPTETPPSLAGGRPPLDFGRVECRGRAPGTTIGTQEGDAPAKRGARKH